VEGLKMNESKLLQMFYDCLENFQTVHEQKLSFLKEAHDNGELMIHPHLIASKWLMQAHKSADKPIVVD
jgi:hypothetical protein